MLPNHNRKRSSSSSFPVITPPPGHHRNWIAAAGAKSKADKTRCITAETQPQTSCERCVKEKATCQFVAVSNDEQTTSLAWSLPKWVEPLDPEWYARDKGIFVPPQPPAPNMPPKPLDRQAARWFRLRSQGTRPRASIQVNPSQEIYFGILPPLYALQPAFRILITAHLRDLLRLYPWTQPKPESPLADVSRVAVNILLQLPSYQLILHSVARLGGVVEAVPSFRADYDTIDRVEADLLRATKCRPNSLRRKAHSFKLIGPTSESAICASEGIIPGRHSLPGWETTDMELLQTTVQFGTRDSSPWAIRMHVQLKRNRAKDDCKSPQAVNYVYGYPRLCGGVKIGPTQALSTAVASTSHSPQSEKHSVYLSQLIRRSSVPADVGEPYRINSPIQAVGGPASYTLFVLFTTSILLKI
ncbi:hypothetical protein B0H19DRAFT_1057928 [Mycena capillaripes]|nr:hypothetical protein B0H19DRAFT_1057928 [Mycena capillaripes]